MNRLNSLVVVVVVVFGVSLLFKGRLFSKSSVCCCSIEHINRNSAEKLGEQQREQEEENEEESRGGRRWKQRQS